MASQSVPESQSLPARNDPEGLWNPYVAGVALGLVLFATFFITGSGLGGSAGFARLADPAGLPRARSRAAKRLMAAVTRYPLFESGSDRADAVFIDDVVEPASDL